MGFKRIGIGILVTLLPVVTLAQNFSIETIGLLPQETDQTSGIILIDDLLVTHNDGSGQASLYELDPVGSLLREVTVENAGNVDWEDISQDQQFIYIADFGNNSGDRTDLRIYIVSLLEYNQGNDSVTVADTIKFAYEDQVSFIPGNQHNFDAEALIEFGDSLYIFTKNRLDAETNIYSLPKTPGSYQAKKVGNIDSQGQISGGTYNPLSNEILLTGYESGAPFILQISNFNATDFDGGQIDRFDYTVEGSTQIEAIAAIDDQDYFITSETSGEGDATLYRLNAFVPNEAPTVNITSPPDPSAVYEGAIITFEGSASDPEDGDLSDSLSWDSDIDDNIGSGGIFNTGSLSVGTHTITASVMDEQGSSGSDSITVTINAQQSEFASASQNGPESAGTFTVTVQLAGTTDVAVDVPFTVSGTATEGVANDFTVTGSPLTIPAGELNADIGITINDDSEIEPDETVVLTLGTPSLGILGTVTGHTATINDDDVNTPPVVTISAPEDGISVAEGTDITFTGSVSDVEDDNTTLTNNLSWDSDLDNNIGSGGSFSTADLSVGTHTITASVTDSHGDTGSDEITVIVNANSVPVVTITAPSDEHTVTESTNINFIGEADDTEDGDISANIVWNSDQDGDFDTGASVDISSLSVNTHIITASVTDSESITSTDQITVTINQQMVEFANASQNGPESAGTFTATVELAGITDVDVDVPFTVTGTATEGAANDFTVTGSPLTIPAGELSADIEISINDDSEIELDETVVLTLGTPSLGILGTVTGHTVTFNDNDINNAPVVSITDPGDGHTVTEGTEITFTATATDVEDNNADLTSTIDWTSNLETGSIGTGGSFDISTLSVGTHAITASVTDSHGDTGSDGITVVVNANNAPVVTITSPSDGTTEPMTTAISFSATAEDDVEGDLSGNLSWASDLDGNIGTGASFDYDALTPGTHIITASVQDNEELEGSDVIIIHITNTAPVVTINSPPEGTTVEEGGSIMFAASAVDAEEGILSPALNWIASLDGGIGSGPSVSTAALSVGTQIITASVMDGGGLEGQDVVTVTVTALNTSPNAAPTVSITNPGDGHAVIEGTNINFIGEADDAEDGDISADIEWNSDQDGDFGTGASVDISSLSVNTHIITASVTDSESITSTDQITVTINQQMVEFASAAQNGPESTGTFTATVQLAGTTDVAVQVPFTVSGTATAGVANDFTVTGSPLTIPAGELSANIVVTINDDSEIESDETVVLTLGTPSLGILGTVTGHTATINDDDVNTPPAVNITAPQDGHTVVEGTDINFTGTATDVEDDDVTLTANIEWTSDLEPGSIGSGGSFNISTLSAGTHTITASVTDSHDGSDSDEITVIVNANSAPVVTITSPADGTTEPMTTTISFAATAEDDVEGDLSGNLSWESDLDGNIGTGASFDYNALTPGTHIITASVQDNEELEGSDVIIIHITNTAPVVTINSPPDGTTVEEGNSVMFAATVIDAEEVDLSTGLNWIASLDGPIGTGPSVSTAALSVGTQSITASVMDGGGLEAEDAVMVTVTAPNAAPSGDNNTVSTDEDITYVLTEADFSVNYSDPENDPLAEIRITILETVGALLYNGGDVTLNQVISVADINNELLTFAPQPDENGVGYDSFDFEVGDGSEFSASSYTMTINVVAVNDPPVGSGNTVSTDEDVPYTFSATDFMVGYSDPDGDPFARVRISSLETDGSLELNGTPVTLNQVITLAQLNGSQLAFVPGAGESGSPYATFGFDVGDAGSFSAASYTMTIDVDAVNDPPVVNITAPADGITVDLGANITFTGTATDPEQGNIAASITWTSNLNGNFGTGASFSYSNLSGGTHVVTASVTDNGGLPANDQITITVNSPPVATSVTITPPGAITEGQTLTGNYSYSDPENDPQGTSTFQWLRNNTAITNATNQSYILTAADVGNTVSFEVTPVAQTGASPGTSVTSAPVGPIVAANSPPSDITLSSSAVNENTAVGTVVGTFSTTDPDNPGDTHTYSFATGQGSVDNGSFSMVGNELQTAQVFNFEVDNSYSIRVQTEDAAGATFSKQLIITISNVNDIPLANNDLNNSTSGTASITINVVSNDTDEDGTVLANSVTITSTPANGTAVNNGNGTVTYTPNGGFEGGDSFAYTIQDNQGATSLPGNVVITVGPNKSPVANDDLSNTTLEDVAISINVIANDVDSDGSIDPASISISTEPAKGLAVAGSNGTVVYTPNPDENGSDEFTYSVNDNLGLPSNQARVVVNVNPVNDPPVASNDATSTPEETAVIINVLANDNDLADVQNGGMVDPTTVSVVTPPANGNAMVNANGTITYTPANGFNGPVTFTYNVRDNQGELSNNATVTVNVSSVNDPPMAVDDPINATIEDNPITINVIANDTDPDGTIVPGSVTLIILPVNGNALNNGDGTVTYTPNPDYNGNDSFTYSVQDNMGALDTALVSIQISGTNDPPVAVDDLNNTTNEDTPLVIELTANDVDPDGIIDVTSIVIASPPENGSVNVLGDGNVEYLPNPDYNGDDLFTYTVLDDGGAISNVATVSITVNNINDPPVAVDDVVIIDEDQQVTVNVISNDTDVDGTLIIATLELQATPLNGTVVNNQNGTVTYTPKLNFNGQDTFSYTIEDDDGAVSSIATVSITINDINDAPVAIDDAVNTDEDVMVSINVIANDKDVDGSIDPASVMLVTIPTNGSATVKSNGFVDYSPDQDFNGLDTFSYTIRDNDGEGSNIATVTVSVNNINDAPVARNDTIATEEGIAIQIDILENDTDPDNPIVPSSVSILTAPLNGDAVLNSNGSVTYTPDPLFNGNDSFNYNVKNTLGQISNVATVFITVNDVNNLPVAVNDSVRVFEDQASPLNILENDSDVDGTIMAGGVNIVSGPGHGTIEITSQNILYTSDLNFTGIDTFLYTVTDDDGGISNEAKVVITVRNVNDAPSDMILSNTFVDEATSPQTVIGSFTVVDVDSDENFSFSLATGTGGEDNGSFSIFGNQLISQVSFNLQQKGSYNIRVKVDDGDSSLEKTFTITVYSDQNPIGIDPLSIPRFHPVTNPEERYSIMVDENVMVKRVLFNYRELTSNRTSWTITELSSDDSSYEAIVDSSVFDEIGIEFEFVVENTDGGTINLPGFTYNQLDDGMDFENLVFGEQQSNYNLFSVPLALNNDQIAGVFEELGPYDNTKWRLFQYENGNLTEYTEGLNTIGRGKGYWLIIKDQVSLNTGSGTTELIDDEPFKLELNQGWNAIGNPYGFIISWLDILEYNGITSGFDLDILIYEGGSSYQRSGVLRPFQGAFAFVESDITLAVPMEKNIVIQGGRRGAPHHVNDENNWEIALNLSTANLRDYLGGLGMKQDADVSKDVYDRVRAPRFIEYLDVNFPKPEYFAPEFSKDIVPTSDQYIWEFTVETNSADPEIKLEWSGVTVGDYDKELWLYNKDREVIVNMQEVQHYEFSNQGTHNFAIYYGDREFIERELLPARAVLAAAYPNPFTDNLTVLFTLPGSIDSDMIRLSVFDLMGRKVKDIWEDAYRPGFYEISWDGTNASGTPVAVGTYLIRLEVNGQESIFRRIIKH